MGYRIAYAEDDYNLHEGTKYLLERSGHTVEATKDGNELVELVREGEFDLVYSDNDLERGTSGIEAAKEIRKFNTEIPIVLHSACPPVFEELVPFVTASILKPVAIANANRMFDRMMGRYRVAYAEDDRECRNNLVELLELDHVVESCADGPALVKMVEEGDFDIVFTDNQLEDETTGVEAAKEIRKFDAEIPIVMYSGMPRSHLMQYVRMVGINILLDKPVNYEELNEAFKRQLTGKGQKIAYASNDPEYDAVLVKALEGAGYVVDAFRNGRVLTRYVRMNDFDLVLTEFDFGDTYSGELASQEIHDLDHGLPVVFHSNNFQVPEGAELISKSMEIAEVVKQVGNYLPKGGYISRDGAWKIMPWRS